MNPSALSVLLLLAGALRADSVWHVEYPEPFCVVEGSTATIPCSFTLPTFPKQPGVVDRVNRVVWCRNHRICHGLTPSVYDSSAVKAGSKFKYRGDNVGNCTLQISQMVPGEAATYRFRIEASIDVFTGPPGVNITVTKGEDLNISVVREGGRVTLTCTSNCSFHQLNVTWYRNGQALSETGPVLHLSDLTNDNKGNYTCSLDPRREKMSMPWSLVLEAGNGKQPHTSPILIFAVAMAMLMAVFYLLLAGFVIAKRRRTVNRK